MSSQFFGLNIAYSGLLAANANLNTTANNISNVQTEGYSRQQVDTQAAYPIRTFQRYGCAGAGVDTLSVERIRDGFYDQKYWNNNSKLGEYNMKSYYMREMEDYFYDSGTNGGFSQIYDKLMITALEEIMKDPGSSKCKEPVRRICGTAYRLLQSDRRKPSERSEGCKLRDQDQDRRYQLHLI